MVFLDEQISRYWRAWHKAGHQWLTHTWFDLASVLVIEGLCLNRDQTNPGNDLKICHTFYVVNAKERVKISDCISSS